MAAVLLCRPKHTRLSQPGLRFTSRSHGFIASALQTRSLCSRVPARQSLVHDEVESEELEALRSGLKVGLHGPHHLIPASNTRLETTDGSSCLNHDLPDRWQ